jgi:hypothetical protein
LLVGHIPEKHYQSLQPKGKVNIKCDKICWKNEYEMHKWEIYKCIILSFHCKH